MSWNSSWPTIPRSLGKLSLLGLYLTEWGLHAFHDLRTFVIIRRIFLLNYLRVRQFELYGEFYMFPWWKDLRQMLRRNPRLAKELSQTVNRNVMRKMTCLGTKRWSFTADHQIFGAKVEILFRSFHWKIPCTNGNSEKVVPFSRLGRSEWKFLYHLQVSWVSYWFHVVTQNPV